MSTITFTAKESGGVVGSFPKGLVRGVAAFEFHIEVSASHTECAHASGQNLVINGVSHYFHASLDISGSASHNSSMIRHYGFDCTLRRDGAWDNGASKAARTAILEICKLILAAAKGNDIVANAAVAGRRAQVEKNIIATRRAIAAKRAELDDLANDLALLEAESTALAGVSMTGQELMLFQMLTKDNVFIGDAVAATKAISCNLVVQRCHTCDGDATGSPHFDESPARIYCESCSGCGELPPDDRCDSCYQAAAELVEAAR